MCNILYSLLDYIASSIVWFLRKQLMKLYLQSQTIPLNMLKKTWHSGLINVSATTSDMQFQLPPDLMSFLLMFRAYVFRLVSGTEHRGIKKEKDELNPFLLYYLRFGMKLQYTHTTKIN